MDQQREHFLGRLEDRLSRLSGWLAGRRRAGEQAPGPLHSRVESRRREISRARRATGQEAHDVVARAQATVDDMERDDEAPPTHGPLRREELQALKRHLRLTVRLLPHISNLDDPRWGPAHEEYERSWDEIHRAFEGESDTPTTAR
jgi:hypothetical protein